MKLPIIYNIQKYSIHDGDGIRTTVFLKGCPLKCVWCHNPESQSFFPELMYDASKCCGCGYCVSVCPSGANRMQDGLAVVDRNRCKACGKCVEPCLGQARELAGRTYTVEELVSELEKDRSFYEESGGGITLSGGEVMAQPMEYIEALLRSLSEKGYSVYVDTCGAVPYERFERVLPFTDTFLYDMKAMSVEKHRQYTGEGNELILENLRRLSKAGARIYLRLPLVDGLNMSREDICSVIEYLKSGVSVEKISLLPYHDFGRSKYGRLKRPYDEKGIFEVPAREKLEEIAYLFRKNGFTKVEIGG